MIKQKVEKDPVALHEFDAEHGLLARMNHPNIIRYALLSQNII
jgi:hypothetical protein